MAAIHRAGTWAGTFKPPKPPEEYSTIRVTFAQGQRIVLIKSKGDEGVTVNGDTLEVVLTQAETLLFQPTAGSPMGAITGPMGFVQMRCYKSATEAPASPVWPIQVYDSLSQEVMGA